MTATYASRNVCVICEASTWLMFTVAPTIRRAMGGQCGECRLCHRCHGKWMLYQVEIPGPDLPSRTEGS